MKLIRKLMFIFISLLLIACSKDEASEELSFDYSFYHNNKNNVLNIDILDNIQTKSTQDKRVEILQNINLEMNVQLTISQEQLLTLDYSNQEMLTKGKELGVFSNLDITLLRNFDTNFYNNGFDHALQEFEKDVLKYGLIDFERYNLIANVLLFMRDDFNFLRSNVNAKGGWGCALAIAGHSVAVVGVGTTCVPNPVTTWACPLAVANLARSYASMIIACSDDE